MRKFGLVLLFVGLAVQFGSPAEAGSQDGLKTSLWVGEPVIVGGGLRVSPYLPPHELAYKVGTVVFNATKTRVQATVEVWDGGPHMKFDVDLVPKTGRPGWGNQGELRTNGAGHGRLKVSAKIPEGFTETITVKISMRNYDDNVYYATELLILELK
jgi:hypothetical protein